MARTIIAGNWKMNKTTSEAEKFKKEFLALLKNERLTCDVVIAPSYTSIASLKGNGVFAVGAQNISAEVSGPYTGEISAEMLKDLNVEYVLVGHSERRALYGETDEMVNRKIKRVLDSGMTPILCIGEDMKERKAERAIEKVEFQLTAGFAGLTSTRAKKVVIAYEPIWAISPGVDIGITATPEQAEEICFAIRKKMSKLYDSTVADEIPILYGGSMTSKNVEELLKMPNINGGLVGGASLKPDEFSKIVIAGNR